MTEDLKRAVFLDRDGTINEQVGYLNHLDRFWLLPGAAQAIRRLNEAGLIVVVMTNQSGVARGYYPESLVETVHRKMEAELAQGGARLDGVYYCPHHPQAEIPEYKQDCPCRKPKPGMILQAAADLGLDPARSFVVGDQLKDIETGRAVNARTVLVKTGYGRGECEYLLPKSAIKPDRVAEGLPEAVSWILGQCSIDRETLG